MPQNKKRKENKKHEQRLVDSKGKPTTKNGIPYTTWYAHQKVNKYTNEKAKPTDKPDDLITRSAYYNLTLVNPDNGFKYEGPGAITRTAYHKRVSRAKQKAQREAKSVAENVKKANTKTVKEINKKRKRDDQHTALPSQKKRKLTNVHPSLSEDDIKKLEKKCNFVYLPSSFDKNQYVYVEEVSILQGEHGVYAATPIPSFTIIACYTGLETTDQDTETDSHYTLGITEPDGEIKQTWSALRLGNFTRFLNFSDKQANVRFITDKDHPNHMFVQTTRQIQSNEQLLINYNTYDENDNENFYFLNIDDNWRSSSKCLEEYENHYHLYCATQNFTGLDISVGEKLYVTSAGMAILNNQTLTNQHVRKETLHLRFLKKAENSSDDCVPFNEFDSLNALMLACYFGQVKNVEFLIKKRVDVNRQQNLCGRSALFFAIQGLKNGHCERENCINVIRTLIQKKANLFIQDKQNQIFLYSAIESLNPDEMDSILNVISKKRFSLLTEYVDDYNEDVFYFSIRHKRLDMLKVLLKYCPRHFNNEMNKNADFYDTWDFKKLLENYTTDEKEELKNILTAYEMPQDRINEIFDIVSNEQTKDDNNIYEIAEEVPSFDLNSIDPSEIVTATLVSWQEAETDLLQDEILTTLEQQHELNSWEEKFSKAEEDLNIHQKQLTQAYQTLINRITFLTQHPEYQSSFENNLLTQALLDLNGQQILQMEKVKLLKETQAGISEEKKKLQNLQEALMKSSSLVNAYSNTPRVYTHSYPQLIFAGSNNHSSRIAEKEHLETAPRTEIKY